MINKAKINKGKKLIAELAEICRILEDSQIGELFGDGTIEELITSILDPATVINHKNYAEYFLANKTRSAFWIPKASR